MIREVDPPRPSTRLSESHELLAGIAAHRRVEPRRLGMLLRGDLDWIVMKALEKDRGRRYETASDFAADIQRHLRGDAVVAAPPSSAYRLRKFVRRNRAFVLASAATCGALLAGVVAFAWQADVAAGERDRAEANASAEARERARAEAVTAFVTKALRSADPRHGGQQGMLVVDAMQNAARMLAGDALRDQPAVAAELLEIIAEVLTDHGRPMEALPLAERALALNESLHSGDHRDLARSLRTVGYAIADLGRFGDALALQQRCLAMLQRLHTGDHEDVDTALNNLATTLLHLGRAAEAEPLLRQSLAMAERMGGGEHQHALGTRNSLGSALVALGRLAEAEAIFRGVRERMERAFPGDHLERVANANNLGHLLWSTGRAAEAEPLFAEALACNRRMYSGDHPETATSLANLAAAHTALGHLEEAQALRTESLRMLRAVFPGDHPLVAADLVSLADLLGERQRGHEAVPLLEQALGMHRRLGDTGEVLSDLFGLGMQLQRLARHADAEPVLVECVAHCRREHAGDHPQIVSGLCLLGRTLLALERHADAQPVFDEALAMDTRLRPEASAVRARLQWFAASTRLRCGEAAGALPDLEAAVAMAEQFLPVDSKDLAEYRASLADCRAALGK